MNRSSLDLLLAPSRLLTVCSIAALLAACNVDPPPGPPAPVETCTLDPANVQTHSGEVSANQTWAAGIHEVASTLTIGAGATLTLAPCSEVRLGPDANITLTKAGARLVAEGTATSPIRFVRLQAASAWGALFAWAPASISLAYATLEGGGTTTAKASAEYKGASLVGRGEAATLPVVIKVNQVAVSGSNGLGAMLVAARFDPASAGLTITGSGWFPLYLGADCLTELPSGTYTGNAVDEILLQTVSVAVWENNRALARDVIIHDRGVPYRVGAVASSIVVGDGYPASPSALLTIEAGVKLRFAVNSYGSAGLMVKGVLRSSAWVPQGALVVAGTAASPVVFTSAADAPAAGNWQGLYFNEVVDPRSRVDYAVIEYAGGDSSSVGVCRASPGPGSSDADCSVILFLQSNQPPASQFITNTRIAHGLGCGFYRGWQTTDLDFRPTNQITGITGCSQSNVPNNLNVCPATDCPLP